MSYVVVCSGGYGDIAVGRRLLCVGLGICMEALCNPTASVQPTEMVGVCLKAVSTLLDDQWTRMRLGSDASLTIELLNVLHRYTACYHSRAS